MRPNDTPEARDRSMSLMEYKPELMRASLKPHLARNRMWRSLQLMHPRISCLPARTRRSYRTALRLTSNLCDSNPYELPGHSTERYELQ
jgi:hypothetical protein